MNNVRWAVVSIATLAAAPHANAQHPWTQIIILSGEFDSTREQLERVRDGEGPAERDIATLVVHERPERGDSVYRARYCPPEVREEHSCLDGGVEKIALDSIDPRWEEEIHLADAEMLSHLLVGLSSRYPSTHLLVALKGRSRFGHILRDDDAGDEAGLDVEGLARALDALKDLRGAPVDVLVLASTASASIEYTAVLQHSASFVVATQESTSIGRGVYFRLPVWMTALRQEPTLAPRDLAKRIAWIYRDPSYSSFGADTDYAVSVIDMSLLPIVSERLTEDFAELDGRGDQGLDQLEQAGDLVWHFGETQTRADLGGLLDNLATLDGERGVEIPVGLRSRLALKAAVIDTFAQPEGGATGVSVFFPANPQTQWDLRKEYRTRFGPFPYDSGWQQILKARLRLARERASGCAAMRPEWFWMLLLFVALRLRFSLRENLAQGEVLRRLRVNG